MKKIYIKPSVSVYLADSEPILQAVSSGVHGLVMDQNDEGGSCSKKYEFTDDFFYDTPWPESESLWD